MISSVREGIYESSDFLRSLPQIPGRKPSNQKSALLLGQGMPTGQKSPVAKGKTRLRPGLPGQSAGWPKKLAKGPSGILARVSAEKSIPDGAQPNPPKEKGCPAADASSCKDGRIKPLAIFLFWGILPGAEPCKDGRVITKSVPYSYWLDVLAKKDSMDAKRFSLYPFPKGR